jgi:hypothetical protein
MDKRAIFRYKHKDGELEVKVLESPKIISTGYRNKWNDLIINFENDKILEDRPYHFTLEFFNEDGFVHSKFIILDVYSYEKDGDNIKIIFGDCVVTQ